ncbi:hypothetical protein JCM18237_30380 [Halorubrum luteum]
MVKRRTTILGLGALATGSGAAFTSAAFEENLDAGSDFRVVADTDLQVEPGVAFRDGSGSDDSFNPSEGEDWAHDGDNSLFDNGGLDEIDLDDFNGERAATINDEVNGNLSPALAVDMQPGGNTVTFGNILQVANNGGVGSRELGIKFSGFGEDVDLVDEADYNDTPDGDVDPNDVVEGFQFEADGTTISTNRGESSFGGDDGVEDQTVTDTVTIEDGETKQIDLIVDLENPDGFPGQIQSAAAPTGNPFDGEAIDTVDLIDEIRFGVDPDNTA